MLSANTWVEGLFGESLLMPDGSLRPTFVALDMDDEKKKHIIVLHFECHWEEDMGYRAEKAPVLAKSYPELKAAKVELVFVSSAESEEEFKADVAGISYPAVPFSASELRTKLCSDTFNPGSSRNWLMGVHGKDGQKLEEPIVFLPEKGADGLRWDDGQGFFKSASDIEMWLFETPQEMSVYAALEGYVNVDNKDDVGNEEAVMQAFKNFDEDGNGKISKAELISVLRALEDSWVHYTDAELNRLFKHVDSDNDGNISFEEFVKWVFSGPKEDYSDKGRQWRKDDGEDGEECDEEYEREF